MLIYRAKLIRNILPAPTAENSGVSASTDGVVHNLRAVGDAEEYDGGVRIIIGDMLKIVIDHRNRIALIFGFFPHRCGLLPFGDPKAVKNAQKRGYKQCSQIYNTLLQHPL